MANVLVYTSLSLLDTFPVGDPETLVAFLKTQYPWAAFVANEEINLVFARDIVSYFSSQPQALIPPQRASSLIPSARQEHLLADVCGPPLRTSRSRLGGGH